MIIHVYLQRPTKNYFEKVKGDVGTYLSKSVSVKDFTSGDIAVTSNSDSLQTTAIDANPALKTERGRRDLQGDVLDSSEFHRRWRRYGGVGVRVLELLHRDWQVELKHVFREANKVADLLAKMADRSSFRMRVFNQEPTEIIQALQSDHYGDRSMRNIPLNINN